MFQPLVSAVGTEERGFGNLKIGLWDVEPYQVSDSKPSWSWKPSIDLSY